MTARKKKTSRARKARVNARMNASHKISTLNEKPLHADLKEWYGQRGDRYEVLVDGFLIDIVRGECLIEIQTRGFAALKRKLNRLVEEHPVRLVHPIPRDKWIVRLDKDRETRLGRRKSPKRGRVETLFEELVSIPQLLLHPSFSLEVLLTQEEELRYHHEGRAWRRKGWMVHERRLLDVLDRRVFETPAELADLVPDTLEPPYTTASLAEATGMPRRLAQQMAYCLREMGEWRAVDRNKNGWLYVRDMD